VVRIDFVLGTKVLPLHYTGTLSIRRSIFNPLKPNPMSYGIERDSFGGRDLQPLENHTYRPPLPLRVCCRPIRISGEPPADEFEEEQRQITVDEYDLLIALEYLNVYVPKSQRENW